MSWNLNKTAMKYLKRTLKVIVVCGLIFEIAMFGSPAFHYANTIWWGIVLGAGWLDDDSV